MYERLSKEQKIKLQKPLYKKLESLEMSWTDVANFLGYQNVSALTPWHEKKEVPLYRVLQVKLFLEHLEQNKE